MPKEEDKPAVDDLPEDANVDAVIETLNLFASIEEGSQQPAEGTSATDDDSKTSKDLAKRSQ